MDLSRKHRLGKRAFLLSVLRRSRIAFMIAVILLAAWLYIEWVPMDYQPWAEYGVKLGFLVVLGLFVLEFARSSLEYTQYTYFFDEEALVITSGYIVQHETTMLYHQIQNVNILRSVGDRLMGLSQVIIKGSSQVYETQNIVLPSLDRHRAKLIQKELLSRARQNFINQSPSGKEEES